MTRTLEVDGLGFELRRSDRRRTIGITVDRDGQLILSAPTACPDETIERIAREKLFWVYTKLALKELLFRPRRERLYASGEGFYYLGRSYRLLITRDAASPSTPPLRLLQGRFMLTESEAPRAAQLFAAWYAAHIRPWIERRVELLADRIGVSPGGIVVRELGYRWGSCGHSRTLNFHWRTAMLPPRIVEYVVAHELVHLRAPHHGAEFWRRLELVMPDLGRRREWLATEGGRL
ncbi:MAG TPA: SprT family zinc-dependent metalloprotease [Chloroflexota bacterium]|nr:SprT family zinc-dependent metalloprotease [Chloroflexota bacterium]